MLNGALSPAEQLSPFELLETRSWRIAKAIESTTRRQDVRALRSKIVLLLLSMRCPLRCAPRKSWYVAGAVARVGVDGLHRLWRGYWTEEPPSIRTFRRHLGELERAGVLVKAPGDWLPIPRDPENLCRRPTYAQTFHLLETDEAAEWWAEHGREMMKRHPNAKTNPDRWRMVFGDWRKRSVSGIGGVVQPLLWDAGAGEMSESVSGEMSTENQSNGHETSVESRAEILREVVVRPNVRTDEIILSLDRAGFRLRGPNRLRLQRNPSRLRGVAAMVSLALDRGDRIRKPGGWIVRAYDAAPADELSKAIQKVEASGWGHRPPSKCGGVEVRDSAPTPIADLLEFFSQK